MKHAIVTSDITVAMESPFIATFSVLMDGENTIAALIGNLGRAMYKTLRPADKLELTGIWKDGSMLNLNEVFAIETIIMPEEAQKGRNINLYP